MSKFVATLFLVLILAAIGGFAYLAFTDIPVEQTLIEETVTLEEFRANKQS